MFGLHFIKTGIIDNSIGKFFTDIYDLRQSSDYDDYVAFNQDDVMDLVNPTNELITQIESLLSTK